MLSTVASSQSVTRENLAEELTPLLSDYGLKPTLARLNVLHVLVSYRQTFTPPQLYRTLGELGLDVSIATIYRVFSDFMMAGLIARHHDMHGNGRYFFKGADSDHCVVCVDCGTAILLDSKKVDGAVKGALKSSGYELSHYDLLINGRCQDCQS